MNKMVKKIVSIVLTLSLLSAIMTVSLSVSASEQEKVRVIVKNDTFSVADGAAWEGTLVDEWVDIDKASTIINSIVKALDNHDYSQIGAENNYFTEINKLSASDGGSMGGWMITLNDWFTNHGAGAYTVADGTLENGDEISVLYSISWGEDIGSSWNNNDVNLAKISFSSGVLNREFDPFVSDYTLTIPSVTDNIQVTPTAYNKNYQVRTYLNDYTPKENGTEYKRSGKISVSDGDKIIVGVGDESWPSMNNSAGANVYTFTIKTDEKNKAVSEKINSTSDYFLSLDASSVSSAGSEWIILGLARNNSISKEFAEGYYNNVLERVNSASSPILDEARSTENSKAIIGLTSIGKDVTNVNGYNLLEPLADFDFVIKQGINGLIFTLIALDTNDYEIPVVSTVNEQTTRELLIDSILSLQLKDGGWTLFGNSADPDMTSMTVQSLAKYYGKNEAVTTAVDKAISKLSAMQTDNGGFSSWGSVNAESCAQVAVALTSVGVNPATDERFIKNGNSLIDALLSFSVENGFNHINGGKFNLMATEQAFYALVSYKRQLNGNTPLYDMTDVFDNKYLPYDVNLDGDVTIVDATLIQKYIVSLAELDDKQVKIADCDNDGDVTIMDATLVQKSIADLI